MEKLTAKQIIEKLKVINDSVDEWAYGDFPKEFGETETVYSKGGQTSNLKSFPVEQAKTFTPILESDELKEFLGEDTHWLFEQLMNKEPMNLRNKIAHGLDLNDNGFCEYFVLCVMKLLLEKQGVFNDKEN